MRYAPDGEGFWEKCPPVATKRRADIEPDHRELRPEFLELILSHDPWASAPRHPKVSIKCALVSHDTYFDDREVIDLSNHKVSPSFYFINGMLNGGVKLIGAKFERTLSLQGSTVTGKLNADRLHVNDNLFLRAGGSFQAIDLTGAVIGGSLQLGGSSFAGKVNLTGATIRRELHLLKGGTRDGPTWNKGASLILRNAKVGALQAWQDSWIVSEDSDNRNTSRGVNLLPTDLTGFTFERLGGLEASHGASMRDAPVDWLIGWIEAQRDHGSFYDPQPYTQLARILDATGTTDKARAIRYAKFKHKQDHDRSMDAFEHAWLTMERIFVGYGVYPVRILYWFFGLVALGSLIAQCSKQKSVRGWIALWYSLDNALPLIETSRRFRRIEHEHALLTHFFHFQKILGFVLATVLVGTLTLLGAE